MGFSGGWQLRTNKLPYEFLGLGTRKQTGRIKLVLIDHSRPRIGSYERRATWMGPDMSLSLRPVSGGRMAHCESFLTLVHSRDRAGNPARDSRLTVEFTPPAAQPTRKGTELEELLGEISSNHRLELDLKTGKWEYWPPIQLRLGAARGTGPHGPVTLSKEATEQVSNSLRKVISRLSHYAPRSIDCDPPLADEQFQSAKKIVARHTGMPR